MADDGKICKSCGNFKTFDGFHRDKTQKDGFKKACKPCRSNIQKKYRSTKETGEIPHNDRLLIDARAKAIRRLIELHSDEFFNLLGRYKREVGIDPSWKQLS